MPASPTKGVYEHGFQDPKKQSFLRVLLVYTVWIGSSVLGSSFIYMYFKDAGIGEMDLISSFFFWSCAALIVIFLLNRKTTSMQTLMIAGIVAYAIAYLSLAFLQPTRELLFAYSFLWGSTSFLFWVPCNIIYFEMSSGREAILSTIYFSMSCALSLFLPLAGGAIASILGFNTLFAVTAICYIFLLFALFFSGLGKRAYRHDIHECLRELKGFKTLFLLESVYGGGFAAVYSIVPLFYFKEPEELAAFLSVTTIFAILASFLVSRRSDQSGKRRRYLWIAALGLAVSTAAMAFARDVQLWYAACGARIFFSTLFWPFTTTILADSKRNLEKTMVGREWLLNMGRTFGVMVVLGFTVLFSDLQLVFCVLAVVLVLYPLAIELKKRHIKIE